MTSLTGLSPNNPRDYVGPNVALVTCVTRNREPTGADYRQPETGKLYPFSTLWIIGKNPTTGTFGDLYYLSKIVSNVAYWMKLSSGAINPLLAVNVQAATAPGINPVNPDGSGTLTIDGATVANHGVPLQSRTRALNAFNFEIQYAGTSIATNASLSGVSHFNSAQFTVDGSGFVSLVGMSGGVDSFTTDVSGPVVANGGGNIDVTGTNVYSDGVVANTITLNLQGTNHTLFVGKGALTPAASLGTGSNGQLMQSKGNAADPDWTTATYPSTVAAGDVLYGSALNTVSGLAAGANGYVLTMVGGLPTWQPGGGGTLQTLSWTLTNSQIKNLHNTPIQLLPAPGVGKAYVIDKAVSKLIYGGTNAFTAGGGGAVYAYYGTTTFASGLMLNANVISTSTDYHYTNDIQGDSSLGGENQALNLYNPSATEIAGNAANNNTMSGTFSYFIATFQRIY